MEEIVNEVVEEMEHKVGRGRPLGIPQTDNMKSAMSRKIKEKWRDPSFRKKVMDRFADPEVKARMYDRSPEAMANIVEGVKGSWTTSVGIRKRIDSLLRKLEVAEGLPRESLTVGVIGVITDVCN